MSGIKIIPQPQLLSLPKPQPQTPKIGDGGQENFGDMLKNAIESIENLQMEAGEAQDKLVRGEAAELHQVMIAAEKAGLSFDLLLEIRRRLVDAYQDLIRMPI
jgi:flagellar hook-basal body complex protein FliE